MCSNRSHRDPTQTPLTAEQIRDLVLVPGQRLGMSGLIVSGGEPTLHPQLIEILGQAVTCSYHVLLSTNLRSGEQSLSTLLRTLSGPDHCIMVSFDSTVEHEMATIRGVDALQQVSERCRELVDTRKAFGARTRLMASLVLQPINAGSVLATIELLLNELHFDTVMIQPIHPYGLVTATTYRAQAGLASWGADLPMLVRQARALHQWAGKDARLQLTGRGLSDWLQYFEDPLQLQGPCRSTSFLFVDAYGRYRGCLFTQVSGSVLQTPMQMYLDSAEYRSSRELARTCKICIHGCS
jgi:pyruvate-formate lyase-activating enzyme